MTLTRTKIAEVFDALADYIEDIEGKKLAAEKAERALRVEKIAANYESSTGEALPAAMREKLASLDQDTLDHLTKVAKNTTESPDSLGSPAEISDHAAPRTVKEAAAQAEDKFIEWICS